MTSTTSPPPKRRYVAYYLASDAFSVLGNAMIGVVLPVLIIMRLGSPVWAGVVAVVTTTAQVILGVFGGTLADRWNRRNLSIVADLLSAASVAALFFVDQLSALTLAWFIGLGLVGAIADLPGQSARAAIGPQIAQHSGVSYPTITGNFQVIQGLAIAVGPALGGLFLAMPNPAWALAATAICSMAAAVLTAILPQYIGDYQRGETQSPLRQAKTALTFMWRQPLMRFLTVLAATVNAGFGVIYGFLVPAHFTASHQEPLVGVTLTAVGIGMIVGGAAYGFATGRWSVRNIFRVALLVNLVGMTALVSLWNAGIILIGAAVAGAALAALNAAIHVFIMGLIPQQQRGSIMGVMTTLFISVTPLAFGLASGLFALGGLPAVQLLVAVSYAAVCGWAAASPQTRTLDDQGS